ncbi:hypothetical protein [Methylobacterium sp.]|uniref:hypothetical protein n=1 Tax=Methylobacterium sp. TaxID=409 RepID=UPI00257C4B38|nr:hypothetical protein [Methylobacterium sp.]
MPYQPKRRIPATWTVQAWNRGYADDPDPDVPVWISIAKFDALWRQTDQYIAVPGGTDDNQPEKFVRAGQWFSARKPMWMPVVGLDAQGLPGFTDGRHRYLWMREHGARSMPFAVSTSEAEAVRALCGTRYRTSWFVPPPVRVPLPAILAGLGLAVAGILGGARL